MTNQSSQVIRDVMELRKLLRGVSAQVHAGYGDNASAWGFNVTAIDSALARTAHYEEQEQTDRIVALERAIRNIQRGCGCQHEQTCWKCKAIIVARELVGMKT